MRGAVEACEAPVCVDEAYDECDAALLPAGVVDECGKDEFCVLVCWRDGWDCDDDDEE